ncbi:two-component sensor histidine kinase [Nonlabens sp. MB-3u-79]|uniref:sensor histidine kinase n=1 Tax=Nonlabens sp. MB-3u-79 TaxID=2058134 RepID=UPI000C30BFFB|nr:ATP-binding protein [Nonlabens sp. MB-3u-79]AUC78407.1 two-component sensor histidine kinase [Nonlabens sp. MB-3u-79]|tara:strand:- start:48994 stop:50082 length:1089 start_codon:yes stop_codon:yes gene_type:complete
MSNNTPSQRKSYRFAIRSSIYITAFLFLILFLVTFIDGVQLPAPILLGITMAGFILCFVIIQYRVQRFIYRRIKRIYEDVSLLESSSFDDREIATDMRTLKEQVERFARNKKIEIETLQIRENYRKEFLGNISHELKTPLFTVQGYIDTLIDGAHKDKAIRKKYLERAQKGVERLTYIVKDMDMITRLEVGDMSLDKENFDVITLVKQVFDQFEMKAAKKNISLVFDMKYDQPVMVYADQERILQVISNLIVNSIKYGKQNGTTEVAVEDLINNKAILRVTDNGEGIKPEFIPRLFERFFRVDRTGSRKEGGSGLGLAIVKHIVEAHGERIYVDSELGIGSEFSFTLEKVSSKIEESDLEED